MCQKGQEQWVNLFGTRDTQVLIMRGPICEDGKVSTRLHVRNKPLLPLVKEVHAVHASDYWLCHPVS